jgi:hypothetical protein
MESAELKILGMRLGWAAVVVWFSANLLSQAIYMGLHGEPYNASAMLSSIGSWYWFFIAIELVIWTTFGGLVIHRVRERVAEGEPDSSAKPVPDGA